jgi:hypothetical protein
MEINFEVLENFFLLQKSSKPPKRLLGQFKTLGRCPKPYPLFEKSGAKTFMVASLFIYKLIFMHKLAIILQIKQRCDIIKKEIIYKIQKRR